MLAAQKHGDKGEFLILAVLKETFDMFHGSSLCFCGDFCYHWSEKFNLNGSNS